MAEENAPTLSGFSLASVGDMLRGVGPDSSGRTEDAIDESPLIDPLKIKEELTKKDKELELDDKKVDDKSTDDSTTDGDTTDDVDDTKTVDDNTTDDVTTDDVSDLGEYEEDITALLNQKFADELGWEIPDDEAPKTISDFIELMKEVVEQESQPAYASDEVKQYDEFVRNGGNLRNFYNATVEGKVDTDAVNIENAFDQKRVLQEHLTNQGYSESNISKMLQRYENAGILEEEATEALELLKDYNDRNKKKLLADQENAARLLEEQQQNFVGAVEESIKEFDSILGYKLSNKDKDDLRKAILTVDAEGYTPYQRKYMSNIKNLLESAFFTMKGDTLGKKIKAQGKSDAVKNLRDKLNANKGNKGIQSGPQETGKTSSSLSVLGSMLQGS